MAKKMPFPLRAMLALVNTFAPSDTKPLEKTIGISNYFMGMSDRRFGLKTPRFYATSDKSFQSAEGHTIRLKIYTPFKTDKPLPVWIYFHGGGFSYGGYNLRRNFTKAIAAKTGCIAVSVSYRTTPKHPFPAAINDCYEATKWIAEHAHEFGGDGARLAVGGESAGGNLSAAVSLMARDMGGPKILHQTLLYPVVDSSMDYPSIEKWGKGYLINKPRMIQFHDAYATTEDAKASPYFSCLRADLHNLPSAMVITAEMDPLCDQGDLYAEKLKQSGVPVLYRRYESMIHDFVVMMPRLLPEAREVMDLMASELRKVFDL